jgi:hypothetical protein
MARLKLLKELTDQIELCEESLELKALKMSAHYNAAIELPQTDLGIYINDPTILGEMVKARLKGEPVNTPAWQIECLFDCEFDYDDYRKLGENDGILHMACIVLNLLGEEELAQRALAAQYNSD